MEEPEVLTYAALCGHVFLRLQREPRMWDPLGPLARRLLFLPLLGDSLRRAALTHGSQLLLARKTSPEEITAHLSHCPQRIARLLLDDIRHGAFLL